MNAPAHLTADAIAKDFSGTRVLDKVDLSVGVGEIHALIGPNGAGKSTLFRILSGEIAPSAGRVRLRDRDITGINPSRLSAAGVARNFQVAKVFNGLTVLENLTIALEAADRWRHEDRRDRRTWVQRPGTWIRDASAEQLTLLGIGQLLDSRVDELSHGDRKMVELAVTLSQEPDLLLLDEPMAGMSPDEVRRCADVLERLHAENAITILLVEHDMETVFRLASTVNVLAGGVVIASGEPSEVRSSPAVREAYLGRRAS